MTYNRLFSNHIEFQTAIRQSDLQPVLDLQPLQRPPSHVIEIWALGHWLAFMPVTASQGHMIATCNCPSCIPGCKASDVSLSNHGKNVIKLGHFPVSILAIRRGLPACSLNLLSRISRPSILYKPSNASQSACNPDLSLLPQEDPRRPLCSKSLHYPHITDQHTRLWPLTRVVQEFMSPVICSLMKCGIMPTTAYMAGETVAKNSFLLFFILQKNSAAVGNIIPAW